MSWVHIRRSRRQSPRTILASILMPAFRARKTIAKAVSSVIVQTLRSWELLVITDDENDYSSLIKEEGLYDSRIHFLRSRAVASGPSAALNMGRESARGLVVTRLDADDWYEPERLATLVPIALRHGVAADNMVAFDDRKKREIGPWLRTSRPVINVDAFNIMVAPIPCLLVFRHDILPKWDEDLTFAEDVIFNAHAFEHVETVPVVTDCLWHYRIRNESLSHSANLHNVADAVYAQLLEEYDTNQLRLNNPRVQRILRYALIYKRSLNRAFCSAYSRDPTISFQEFVLGQREAR